MPEKAKIFLIYLLVGLAPIVLNTFPSLGAEITARKALSDFLIYVPTVGLVLLGLLGWQLNQTRVLWACAFLLALYHFLRAPSWLAFLGAQPNQTWQVTSVALPLSLSLLFSTKEAKLWSEASWGRLALALTPFLFFAGFMRWDAQDLNKLFFWNLAETERATRLPYPAWISASILGFTAFLTKDQKVKIFLEALTAALVPVFFALHLNLATPASPMIQTVISFSTATLILLHAIFHMYWKRVYRDPLTEIPNRQSLDERLHTLTGDYALAMVDVDHFKQFNDTYGHSEGDNVLRMVAKHLQDHFGNNAYRYGGEEFCLVFEGVPTKEAERLSNEARKELEKTEFVLRSHVRRKTEDGKKNRGSTSSGKKVGVTVSIGIAAKNGRLQTYEQVLKQADKALYQAKDSGRNRVVAQ